jgi:DNA repair protein RadA/Sms
VAVLARRAGIGLGSHDVYANLAGGLAADDPGLDLAVAIALASTFRDRPVAAGTVAIAEIGLLGELRSVGGLERRLREAARLGFTRALVPPGRGAPPAIPGIALVTVRTVREALDVALGPADG